MSDLHISPVQVIPSAPCQTCGKALKFGEPAVEVDDGGCGHTWRYVCPECAIDVGFAEQLEAERV